MQISANADFRGITYLCYSVHFSAKCSISIKKALSLGLLTSFKSVRTSFLLFRAPKMT